MGADVAGGRATADRKQLALGDELLERRGHLLAGDLVALEVALHQLVRRLRDDVHQLVVVLVGDGPHVLGDLDRLVVPRPVAAVVSRRPCAPGRRRRGTRSRSRSGSRPPRSGRRAALRRPSSAAKKSARSRSSMLISTSRESPSSSHRFHSRPVPTSTPITPDTVDDRPLDHPQRREHVGLEAGLAGRVDQVDRASLPLQVGDCRRDRHASTLLLVVVVTTRSTARPRCPAG